MVCDIIYRDEHLVAINKPYGYFVHKSSFDATSGKVLMKILKKQLGQFVYPVHRLDRKTSGVLLFALSKESLSLLNKQFEERSASKEYTAICRGFFQECGSIDYDIDKKQAITKFELIQNAEMDLPFGKFSTSRYSLVKFIPLTGRMHQIRKHAAHIFHPILGDRPHGCNKQNRLWLEKFMLVELMLHARMLKINHPYEHRELILEAAYSSEFKRIADIIGFTI